MRPTGKVAPLTLAAWLAAGPAFPATSAAVLRAAVTSPGGQPLAGLDVRLVSLDSGRAVHATTDPSGVLAAQLPPGLYVLDTHDTGYALWRGPRVVALAAGRLHETALALAPQRAPAESPVRLSHEPVGCFVAGQHPQLEAAVAPAEQFVGGRVYFRSARSTDYYYVDMTNGIGGIVGRLPKPKLEASPVTYYIQVVGKGYTQTQTREIVVRVVERAADCEGKVAAIAPNGPSTVYAAGGGVAFPADFATGAGTFLGMSTTTAVIAAAVVAASVVTIILIKGPTSGSR